MSRVGGDGQTVGQVAAYDLDHHERRTEHTGNYQLPSRCFVDTIVHRVYGMAVHTTDRPLDNNRTVSRLVFAGLLAIHGSVALEQRNNTLVSDSTFCRVLQTISEQ